MRLVWPENVNFRRKMAVFGGSGGLNLQNQKLRLCNHKTQLLSRITFTVSLKIKPDNQMYANVSDPHPPLAFNVTISLVWKIFLEDYLFECYLIFVSISSEMLHLLASLIGNDYIKSSTIELIFTRIKVDKKNKSENLKHRYISLWCAHNYCVLGVCPYINLSICYTESLCS